MKLKKNNDNPINDQKIINGIRALGIDMITEAGSGHPGIVLGAAPILYTLYANHLNFSPDNSDFFNRDRFIMSAGHGSALLYSTLFMAGVLELDDLKQFRKINSKTPGHPEIGVTPNVDMSTGALGSGFATAVGIALAEEHMKAKYNNFSKNLINFHTYVLCGDGDLEEGISYEAASLAGTLGLSNLIVLYDSNNNQLDSNTNKTFTENIQMRFEACNWNYIKVDDGENYNDINNAIESAKNSSDKPTIIEIKTTIGKYSKLEGTNFVHGGVLTKEDITNIKNKLNVRDIPFNVTNDIIEDFQYLINKRCKNLEKKFNRELEKLNEDIKEEIKYLMNSDKQITFKDLIYDEPEEKLESPRDTSGKVLNALSKINDMIFGGSADLFSSTKTYVKAGGDFEKGNYNGKNIFFGVRENAMGAIANGIALVGYRPYVSTFLSFSNYMYPSIRLAAMLKLPITYVLTHDSISIGEDGPTHQPVEQLAQLRVIPNLEVFRPCDANEVIGSYKTIMNKKDSPAVISLSKKVLPILKETDSNKVEKGGYIVKKEERKLDAIIISTGEEVHLAIEVAKRLYIKGIDIRVVSMPSISRFLEQDKQYIDEILPVGTTKIVIEKSASMSWNSLIYNPKYLITLDTYGKSGTEKEVEKYFGFDPDKIEEKIEKLLK